MANKLLFDGRGPANKFLFTGRFPANKFLFAWRVLANKFLFAGRVLANKFLFAGRVPANNLFHKLNPWPIIDHGGWSIKLYTIDDMLDVYFHHNHKIIDTFGKFFASRALSTKNWVSEMVIFDKIKWNDYKLLDNHFKRPYWLDWTCGWGR